MRFRIVTAVEMIIEMDAAMRLKVGGMDARGLGPIDGFRRDDGIRFRIEDVGRARGSSDSFNH